MTEIKQAGTAEAEKESIPVGFRLEAAVLVAQKSLRPVLASAVNQFHHYKYADSETIIQAAREALHAAGLVLRRPAYLFETDTAGQAWLKSQFLLTHPQSGETEEHAFPFPVTLEIGKDKEKSLDKAVTGALTVSLAYFLRDLLLIPREDEPGGMNNRGENRGAVSGAARNQQPQNRAAGPAPVSSHWFTTQRREELFELQKAAGYDSQTMGKLYGPVAGWDLARFEVVCQELRALAKGQKT